MIQLNPTLIILSSVGFFILSGYIFLVLFSLKGLANYFRNKQVKPHIIINNPHISIVVAFRNEAKNIKQLCYYLTTQDYHKNLYEIILVNDHSTDNWEIEISDFTDQIEIINASGEGKKNAIKEGINAANGEYITTTDADCEMSKDWLKDFASQCISQNSELLIGPVIIKKNKHNFLSAFQQMDFMSLQMIGLGMANQQHPIMCNGANLMFKKDAYLNVKDQMKSQFMSGDDQFLMHAIKQGKLLITMTLNRSSVVTTAPKLSWYDLFRQRIRWASKSSGYSDRTTISIAILIFLTNLVWLSLATMSVFNFNFWILFLSFALFKAIIDRSILLVGYRIFNITWIESKYWIIAILHPLFTVFVAIMSFFIPVSWKGRKVKTISQPF